MIDTNRVITARTELGLSQRQLAKHVGVNRETIRRLERGADPSRLTLAVLGRLAGALRVTPSELLTEGAERTTHLQDPMELNPAPLDHNAARLLRRIHRGEDVRRTMSRSERELILPQLVRQGLITLRAGAPQLAPLAASSLGTSATAGPASTPPPPSEHSTEEPLAGAEDAGAAWMNGDPRLGSPQSLRSG